jgi:hypothetical protein
MATQVTKISQEKYELTPMQMISVAVQNGHQISELSSLIELQEKVERREAEKAFYKELVDFQRVAPTILKQKNVSFGNTNYNHATLDQCVSAIRESLIESNSKLAFTFETGYQDGTVIVTCVIRHELGHEKRTSLPAPPDSSGQKNSIQQVASTVTYLQRYTLLAAFGVATADTHPDTDGRVEKDELPTESDYKKLHQKIKFTGCGYEKFLAGMKVEKVEDLDQAGILRANKRLDDYKANAKKRASK